MELCNTLPFTYQPLDEPGSIRLLVLQPGPPDADIHCSLIHTTLAKCCQDIYDHYTALSYVWGDPDNTKTILLNDLPFQVTTNLASALHGLRDDQRPLRLWADAVCIDQSNIPERNDQVKLMKDIYTMAHQTVAYLGESNEEIVQAFEALQANEGEDLLSSSSSSPNPHVQLSPINTVGNSAEILRLQGVVAAQILTRPWFDRVWIYQELVLSKIVWVQCGRSRVDWDYLCKIVPEKFMAPTHREPSPNLVSHDIGKPDLRSMRYELVGHMNEARQKFKESVMLKKDPATFLETLLARRGFAATDPRDMIYGHMAVSRLHDRKFMKPRALPLSIEELEANYHENMDEFERIMRDPISDVFYAAYLKASKGLQPCSPIPVVDYRKSVCEVFTEATRFIMDFDQSIHALLHVETIKPSVRRSELPSWVPDWSLDSSNYPTPLHSCSVSLEPPPMVTFTFWDNTPIFASLGTIRGTIFAVSPVIKDYDGDLDKEEEFHSLSRKRVIDSRGRGELPGELELESEVLYCQLYDLWRHKLGDVFLGPYRRTLICSAVWKGFDWVNYKRELEREPSSINWGLTKPSEGGAIRDTSLEGILMRHPFTIFPTKILTGRKVAMYNDGFLDGYCIVPACSQPGDVLCYLRDPLSPLVVLRPVSDSRRQEMTKVGTENWKENLHPVWFGNRGLETEGLDPRHFTWIGEAWIQKSPFSIMQLERAHFLETLIIVH